MSDAPPRAEECAGLAHRVTGRYGRILVLLMTVALAALVAPAGALTWTTTTVDSTGSAGYYTSLAITSGNPSISYYDATNSDLKYVRATDASGTAWGTPITVDSTGSVGRYTSLAITNGNPSISYYDNTNGDLKYVRATDASGTAWGTPEIVDSTGSAGLFTSLAITNGNPSIGYYDATNADLKYARGGTVAPVSSFTASPVSGDAPLTVTFTDTSTNIPDSWNWNFGSWSAADGGLSTQLNPVHTYDSPGTYVVTLTVLNAVGGDTSSQTITVASSGTAQVTVLEADPVQPATVYAGLDGQGVYRSPDSGSSWSHLTLPTGANLRIRALAPVRLAGSPATTLYAGSYGGGVYRSTDGGATWGTCSALPDQYVLSLVANSTAGVYAGTESGVYASTDGCSSWIAVNNGLP